MTVATTQPMPATDTSQPTVSSVACKVCGGTSLDDLGPIHHAAPALVAGVPIDLGDIQFHLLACPRCSFQFKHPPISETALFRCYQRADASNWEDSPDPRKRRFDTLRQLLETHTSNSGKRILDVGCFNGALLDYLGASWQRFGVEPSHQAAALAMQRGVTVLGATINAVPPDTERFDVILLIDVIEHIPDPLPLFATLRSLLKPRGTIVIGTGDTEAWTWRMQKNRYWYCSLPEHVSFYCQRTLWQVASMNSMDTIAHVRTSHVRSSPITQLRQSAVNVLHEIAFRCRGSRNHGAPGWLTARDHMLHITRAR